jgi:hypothetical protein
MRAAVSWARVHFNRQFTACIGALARRVQNAAGALAFAVHQFLCVADLGQFQVFERSMHHHAISHAFHCEALSVGALLCGSLVALQRRIENLLVIGEAENSRGSAAVEQRESTGVGSACAGIEIRAKGRLGHSCFPLHQTVLQAGQCEIAAVRYRKGDRFF